MSGEEMTVEERAAFARQTALSVLREDEDLLELLGEGLLDLSEQVKHGGKGKVALTLNVLNTKKQGFSETVFIEGTVKVTPPPPPATEQNLFYAIEGKLTRRDPRQPNMPLFNTVERDESGDEDAEDMRAQ